jgi:Na+-transporting methylmalonyl-CoA/oxaloacetate decarboxylase gamma subunit
MLIAGVIVVCIVLAVLAFLLPRLSSVPQRGVDKTLGEGQQGAAHAPGKLGKWLQKPFRSSRKAADKSASAGRKGRGKMPF